MPINTPGWNRVRYTLLAPLYDSVAGFRPQRRRSIELLAPLYDSVAGFRPQRRRSIELLAPRAGERILVDGCGTGADLAFLPADVEVVATDLTPAMVERTRQRAQSLGRAVDARVMDAQALDLADASFDAVVLHLILAVVPEPVAAIREAARVLKPGGRAVVFDKWVPDAREPSLARRAANLVARIVATEITRKLGPLADAAGLHVEHREPAGRGGFFSIALLRKPQ